MKKKDFLEVGRKLFLGVEKGRRGRGERRQRNTEEHFFVLIKNLRTKEESENILQRNATKKSFFVCMGGWRGTFLPPPPPPPKKNIADKNVHAFTCLPLNLWLFFLISFSLSPNWFNADKGRLVQGQEKIP